MVRSGFQIARVIKSLIPTNPEELSLLRFVLYCAQLIQQGALLDQGDDIGFGISPNGTLILNDQNSSLEGVDLPSFMESIPEEARRYFHGIVEALEIYQSIHGQPIPVQSLTLSDKTVYELKQIRDMVLQDGIHLY